MESMFDFVYRQLQATRGEWGKVAEGSGVSQRTLEKIGYGKVDNPRFKTLEKLASYFHREAA